MSKMSRLIMSLAGAATCFASAAVANATAIHLTPTYIMESYTTLAKDTIEFFFNATVPSDLTYSLQAGALVVDSDTVGPFIGQSSYALPGFTAKGITIDYYLTPSVPEPATWAMMLAGLGIVGGAMRARKAGFATA